MQRKYLANFLVNGMAIKSKDKIVESITITNVKFMNLADSVIEYYLETGEWEGKAGGYGIQGVGAMFVEGIEGCFNNVVGVPINGLLKTLLVDFNAELKP
jgi:septum formation protein